jgi:ADP-dependent NAD(P)H-hydrate dehydratase
MSHSDPLQSAIDLPSPDLPQLTTRRVDSHKGDFGHALIIGGSRGMSGAVALAGLACLRTGAGLVSLLTAESCAATVAGFSPCMMVLPAKEDSDGRLSLSAFETIESMLPRVRCLAIGPGLGQSRDLQQLVLRLLRHRQCPIVIDADGLNNLAQSGGWPLRAGRGIVLTPHPGEWARLLGRSVEHREQQCHSAMEMAAQCELTIVLKGHRTLITDGHTEVRNASGTPAMATGGSGDVLTGVITGLICQGLNPRDAAHLGVYVHGLAGELAQAALGSHVVLPTDLIAQLGRAFQTAIAPNARLA